MLGVCLGALSPRAAVVDASPLDRDFSIRVWKKEHGLPDERIQCLHVDRRGFLWAGTRRGLVRFDGSRFRVWSRSTSDLFVNEDCRALAEDQAGNLWVGTADGLIRLGASPRRWWSDSGLSVLTIDRKIPLVVTSLAVVADGRLLMGAEHGLWLQGKDGGWAPVAWPDEPEKPIADRVSTVLAGRGGERWAGRNAHLFEWTPQRGTWESQSIQWSEPRPPHPFALAQTDDGAVYAVIGVWQEQSGHLYRRDPAGWQRVQSAGLIENFSNPPWLFADRSGGLWYPTGHGRLARWSAQGVQAYRLTGLPETEVVLCMTEDGEGNLWMGTLSSGLVCLIPRHIQTLTTRDGLPGDNTWALLEAADGALWVGTDRGVARLHDGEAQTWDTAAGLCSDHIRALAEDAQGHIWIGTAAGLNIWDHGKLTSFRLPGEWYRSKTRVLLAARDGTVWLGSAVGLHQIRDGQSRSWSPRDGLPNENVLALLEDHLGRLWLGTGGGGLARFDRGRFEVFGENEGLSSLNVWVIHEDADGFLWLGTDRGLNCLRNGRIQTVTTAEGLPDNLVNGLVEDRLGWFWVGHDNGIYRVQRQALLDVLDGRRRTVNCVRYDREDGLLNPETNGQKSQPPALLLRDGRVAFTSVAGVAIFDPVHPPELTNGPPARIERLTAGGREVFVAAPGVTPPAANRPREEWARVEPGEERQVEITFTAASFRSAEDTRFRHRLLGLDDTWQDSRGRRSAAYAFLPPGDYVFEVQAGNQYGHWSEAPATVAFRVIPHFYERRGVQVAGVLLVLFAGFAVVRWRMAELRRVARLEEEAARAQERLRLARDLHDGLGSNLTELTLLSGVGDPTEAPPEDLASRFRRLSESTHEALHALRDLIWTTSPQADTLEGLISRLRRHAERLGEAAKVPVRYDLPLELPAITLGPNARRDLLRAVDEALNNAVRHAGAGEIWLRVRANDEEWFVEVADNGRGFEVPDPASPGATGPDADRGLGLASMRERVESLGGRCEIRSQPGRGTRVRFHLPLTGWEARG